MEREVGIKPNAKTLADKLANLLVDKEEKYFMNKKKLFYLDIYPLIYVEHLLELLMNKILHQYHRKYLMHRTSPVNIILFRDWKTIFDFNLVQKAAELVRTAKNPVCLLGSQSTLPPTSTSDVVEALEVNEFYRAEFNL